MTIPGVRLRVHRQHSQFWPILTRFVDYYSPFCGPEAISIVVEPQVAVMCRSSTLAVLADSGPFRGLLLTILGPKRFPRLTNPEVRLRVGHQHSWFLSILVRFVHYYLPFFDPRVISTIDDPRGAFTCPSATLTVLANSDPFRGLLLTVLGSRSDFQDLRTQGCVYVSVINTRSFARL